MTWNPMDAGHARAKKRKKRLTPEADLQANMVKVLTAALPRGAVMIHVPNEGKRGPLAQAEFKKLGGLSGVPDLVIFYDSRALFIEVKAPKGGKVSGTQQHMHQRLRDTGFDVLVARSVEEVLDWLADRLPMRGRIAA